MRSSLAVGARERWQLTYQRGDFSKERYSDLDKWQSPHKGFLERARWGNFKMKSSESQTSKHRDPLVPENSEHWKL